MRRKQRNAGGDEGQAPAAAQESGQEPPQGPGVRAHGPWDVTERPVSDEEPGRAHLGALSVQPVPGVELRLQVDDASGQVGAALLVAEEGAMELRVFAAPRGESIWSDIRRQIGAEATRRGGTATEVEGPYGPAMQLMVTGTASDGQTVTQPSTVHGIEGPRWLLRVSTFGRPAVQHDPDGALEQALREVVVIRGNEPMAPGEMIPLVLPAGSRRLEQP